jgi:hypothetical protein
MKRQRSSTERNSSRRLPLLVPTLLALSTAAGVILLVAVGNEHDDRHSFAPLQHRAKDHHHWTRRRAATSDRALVQTAGDGGAVGSRSLAAPGKEQADEDAAKHATSYAQRHPNYYNTNRYNSAAAVAAGGSSRSAGMEQHKYYNYEDDDKMEDFRRRYHHGGTNGFNYTDLTDVGLCLLTALGWAVWMISSAVSSKQAARAAAAGFLLAPDEGGMDERFWQRRPRDPVTGDDIALLNVFGNVLQVSKVVEQDSATEDGAGLVPLYRVVIDYNVVKSDQPPTEPPSTALTATPPPPLETLQIRKEFDTRIELEPGFANVELLVLPEEPTLSMLKGDYEEQMRLAKTNIKHGGNDNYDDDGDENDDEISFLDGSQCKRLSTVLAAFLVFASLAGTIQVVMLMEPDRRWQGWLCLCSGVALLLPCAVVLHKLIKLCAAYQEPSAKQGIVIGSGVLPPGHSGDTMMLLYEACLDAPSACCCEDGRQLHQVASYMAPETSGCYFIRYPTTSKRAAAATTTTTATTAADVVSDGPTAAVAMADRTDSSLVSSSLHEHILSSSNSSISSLSSDSPMHGQDMWQPVSGSMDSL